jgi:protein SCO1/2
MNRTAQSSQCTILMLLGTLAALSALATNSHADGTTTGAVEWQRLIERLPRLEKQDRATALGRLRELARLSGTSEASDLVIAPLAAIWTSADGATDDELLAGVLDVMRTLGPAAREAGPDLTNCLRHASRVYEGRDRWDVVRLRAYLLVTLGEIGMPAAGFRHLLDAIANANDRAASIEVAGAVRAARSTGDQGRVLVPTLLRLVPRLTSEVEFSLERYRVDYPHDESTTIQLEAIRTLGEVCRRDDEAASVLLRRVADASQASRWEPRSIRAAKAALVAIAKRDDSSEAKTECTCCPEADLNERSAGVAPDVDAPALVAPPLVVSPRLSPEQRTKTAELGISFEDQDGREGKLEDLIDRPTLLTFFYARCQNQLKCSAAVVRLAELQERLGELGLDRDVRLLAITYEPTIDNASRLRSFGLHRGLRFDGNARVLRLAPSRHKSFVKALKAPVSFSAGVVNTHGVALLLLDRKGRLARRYHTVLWDNEHVIADVRILLAEKD